MIINQRISCNIFLCIFYIETLRNHIIIYKIYEILMILKTCQEIAKLPNTIFFMPNASKNCQKFAIWQLNCQIGHPGTLVVKRWNRWITFYQSSFTKTQISSAFSKLLEYLIKAHSSYWKSWFQSLLLRYAVNFLGLYIPQYHAQWIMIMEVITDKNYIVG